MLTTSIVGLGVLIGAKEWELETGHIIFAGSRPAVARTSRRVIFWTRRVLPTLARYWTLRLWKVVLGFLHVWIAKGILAAERLLERTLGFIRRTTSRPIVAPGQASAFLREVAEHKKKLLKDKKIR